MSYKEALEAAGAEVAAFEEFGSYQGDWWAKVVYEGATQWVHGSFGSCSGCDAFQAEFDYVEERCDEHRYTYSFNASTCAACCEAKEKYDQKLAEFGRGYLTSGEHTQEEAEKEANRYTEWDTDAQKALKFLQDNPL